MKKLFNNTWLMLACMAMTAVFTACEPEPETIDEPEKALAFVCDEKAITEGSTYTSSKLDEGYAEMGMTRFVPGIDLVGDADGKVVVTVKSLNETMVEICAFGGCQITLPYAGYVTSVSGDLTAGAELPLDIHYTPTSKLEDGIYRAEALITAYYEGYEEDAVSFTLVMTNAKVE